MSLPLPAAKRAMVRDMLPRWVRQQISDLDFSGLTMLLDWMQVEPDCEDIPIKTFVHKGVTYHFPAPKGQNVCCLEYALADDTYTKFVDGAADNLPQLVATIIRESDTDKAGALKRNDKRVALYSKSEAEERSHRQRKLPPEYTVQALLYFGGLKAYIHRVYGSWLFEASEDDEGDEDAPKESKASRGPDFGWWGMFQQVAEAGVFGNLQQVYQTSIHDVCIFLVRKRIEADSVNANSSPKPTQEEE